MVEGFRVLGLRGLGLWALGFRFQGFRVSGFYGVGLRVHSVVLVSCPRAMTGYDRL